MRIDSVSLLVLAAGLAAVAAGSPVSPAGARLPAGPAVVIAAIGQQEAVAQGLPDPVAAAAELAAPLTAASLEAHVRYLADDRLEGRMTGEPGGLAAARYLAEVLGAAGVEPGGDEGTFFQAVPLEQLVYAEVPRVAALLTTGVSQPLVYGVEFYGLSGPVPNGQLEVVTVRSAGDVPERLTAGQALFIDGNVRERREWLDGREGFALEIRPGSRRAGQERTDPPRGARWVAGDGAPRAAMTVRGPALELFRSGQVERVVVASGGKVERLDAVNVVGVLPGAGPQAAETVVFTAHYDHIGTREPAAAPEAEGAEAEDTVYNGADDDASGCAAVLELARAWAADGPHARTLVFLLVTGEEIGLLGTKYYLDHPLRPLSDTVANINFEMIGRPDELIGGAGRVWLTGDERSNLGASWRAAGIEVVADPRPDQDFFRRSDNYAFAVLGIVAQTLSTYNLHGDYHRVSDEADLLDYDHMETVVRTSLEACRPLIDGALEPQWLPGQDPSQR